MTIMASQITCTWLFVQPFIKLTPKKTSEPSLPDVCEGNPSVTGPLRGESTGHRWISLYKGPVSYLHKLTLPVFLFQSGLNQAANDIDGIVASEYPAVTGAQVTNHSLNITETKMSSFWWNYHHWLHRKLSFWHFRYSQWWRIHQNEDIFVSVMFVLRRWTRQWHSNNGGCLLPNLCLEHGLSRRHMFAIMWSMTRMVIAVVYSGATSISVSFFPRYKLLIVSEIWCDHR